MRFSQRMGYTPIKQVLQIESMDDDLRTGLWNVLSTVVLKRLSFHDHTAFMQNIWVNYFKFPVDQCPTHGHQFIPEIRDYFFGVEWYEVYDFLEFVGETYLIDTICDELRNECNKQLEKELSGYRFIGGKVTPITEKEEIRSIETALSNTHALIPVKSHLKRAIELLSDKQSPDHRNSIKESISSVESLSKIIAKNHKASLGDALNILRRDGNIDLHGSLIESFKKLYGYTSDADGIRHGLMEKDNLDIEDSIYMLVSCSAFVNYLITKASKANIELSE